MSALSTRNIPVETAEALISSGQREVLNGLRRVAGELLRPSRAGVIFRLVAESVEDGRFWAFEYAKHPEAGVSILTNDPIVEAREVYAVERVVTKYENLPPPTMPPRGD